MQCPVCSDVQLAISSRDGVEIDYCPQCRGVWLDRGELDKILDRVAATPAPPPPRRPAPAGRRAPLSAATTVPHAAHDDSGPRVRGTTTGTDEKRGRGSFLEDLFDFD